MGRLVLVLVAITLVSCAGAVPEEAANCTPPPAAFQDTDLVGTWVASHAGWRTDTLTFREDGLYKQVIDLTTPRLHYVGEWQEWRIEYSTANIPYVHMVGMRLYAYLPYAEFIDQGVVGGGDLWFVDFCAESTELPGGGQVFPGIQMPKDEVLLTVTGVPTGLAQPPRGILLAVLPVSDAQTWSYQLQEP